MTITSNIVADLRGALTECLHQIEQMHGMFDDADGRIQAALDDGHKALNGSWWPRKINK